MYDPLVAILSIELLDQVNLAALLMPRKERFRYAIKGFTPQR